MAELKDGMNGPVKLTVKMAAPKGVGQDGSGTQWVGKYPPHKDVLQWDTIFEETGNLKITVCAKACPATGTVYDGAWIDQAENKKSPQYPFRTMFTKEEKAAKDSAPRPGGGAKPNYTLEQESYKDGQIAAITAIQGGLKGSDGKDMEMTLPNIRRVAAALQGDILAAKKSEA